MKIQLAVIVTVALGVMVAPAEASAPTPASYRAYVNSVCRFYTPRFRRVWAAQEKAAKAKDFETYGYFLGQGLVLILAQDHRILITPVPAELRAQMTPILRLLKSADSHARLALRYAGKRNRLFVAELSKIQKLTAPLNRRFDRAGLRECGSNQT